MKSLNYKHQKPYVLIDPRDHMVFYVGITARPLHTRLTEHIHSAISGKGGRARMRKIREILEAKKRPLIAGLGRVKDREWQTTERDVIKSFKRWDARLTNRAGGGAGNDYKHTEAEKGKIAASVSRARSSDRANVVSLPSP